MKIPAIIALYLLALTSGWCQLLNFPPDSSTDGIFLQPAGPWDAWSWGHSALYDYRIGNGNSFQTPTDGSADLYGRHWGTPSPDRSGLIANGGSLRAIFLGLASAGLKGFGYSYDGDPAGAQSFTVASSAGLSALTFGEHLDISFDLSSVAGFDFWADGSDRVVSTFSSTGVLWTQSPFATPTFLPGFGAVVDTPTWVASVLDPSTNSEYRFALQQFLVSGAEFGAVPEAGTLGMAGSILLVAVAMRRALRVRRNQQSRNRGD